MTGSITKSTRCEPDPPVDDRPQAIVEVWLTAVGDSRAAEAGMARLGADEQARVPRFRFERDRTCFVNRRVFLREVLGRYLQADPGSLRFTTSGNGRPELVEHKGLSFNASHSSTLAVVAVSRGPSVGVDIERLRAVPDGLGVADDLFTTHELASLRASIEAERSATFLRLWTRKEAVVKALGTGLSTPLSSFDVSRIDRTGVGHMDPTTEMAPHAYADLLGIQAHIGAIAVAGERVRPGVRMMGQKIARNVEYVDGP